MSGLGASADCPAPIIASGGVSICQPLINGSPVSVIYSAARCGTTNYSLNDTVLGLGADNPNYKGGKVKVTCQQCETEFEVKPAVVKRGGGKFCSRSCTNLGSRRVQA